MQDNFDEKAIKDTKASYRPPINPAHLIYLMSPAFKMYEETPLFRAPTTNAIPMPSQAHTHLIPSH